MMTAFQTKKPNSKLNARIKKASRAIFDEKETIKMSFGNDSAIPQTIYNRIQSNLNKGNKVEAILKVKMNDGTSFWINNHFKPSHYNDNNQFSVSTHLVDENKITKVKKLYNILNKIENRVSVSQANKYLEGFLETNYLTFNQLTKA